LNAELVIELLKKMMRHRKRAVHLVLDGLPAHKKALVKDYVQSIAGRLTLHFLPGYAPDLNRMTSYGVMSNAPGRQGDRCRKEKSCTSALQQSCWLCSAIDHSCGHSFVPRPSPILQTAE
jgi:hypothetical protein